MKKYFIKILIPSLLLVSGVAYGEVQCQAIDISGNKVPLHVSVYFGKGPNGADVTVTTTPTAKNQFLDTYHSRGSRGGNGTTFASLTSYEGGAHQVGSIYLSLNLTGEQDGSIHLLSKAGETVYALSCSSSPQASEMLLPSQRWPPPTGEPTPYPTPYIPNPNPRPCPRC